MILPSDKHLFLGPLRPQIPYTALIVDFRRVQYDGVECRRLVETLLREWPWIGDYLLPERIEQGGFFASQRLLFDDYTNDDDWLFAFTSSAARFETETTPTEVSQVAHLIRDAVASTEVNPFRERWSEQVDGEILAALTLPGPAVDVGQWPPIRCAGVYRREHASVVIASSTTRILVDPMAVSGGWTTHGSRCPGVGPDDGLDAIAVTHHHTDHWHLASLIGMTTPRTPVIVPRVPGVNLLCDEDMADSLRTIGQPAHVLDWYESVRIGDIEIEAIPFYGEQPTRTDTVWHPGVRNWGNCYRFDTPTFSVALLADAGSDPSGDTIDALERSVQRKGPLDLLMSCCHLFPEAINVGLAHYQCALPFDYLRTAHQRQQRREGQYITLGPRGVAEACRVSRARYFAPYAHGFLGIGRDPRSAEGGRPTERMAMAQVSDHIKAIGLSTRVLNWLPGDAVVTKDAGFDVIRYATHRARR